MGTEAFDGPRTYAWDLSKRLRFEPHLDSDWLIFCRGALFLGGLFLGGHNRANCPAGGRSKEPAARPMCSNLGSKSIAKSIANPRKLPLINSKKKIVEQEEHPQTRCAKIKAAKCCRKIGRFFFRNESTKTNWQSVQGQKNKQTKNHSRFSQINDWKKTYKVRINNFGVC